MNKYKWTPDKGLRIYLKETEYNNLVQSLSNTTCRSLSEYGRALLLGGPVTFYYRNKSYDEFLDVGIQFRKRLDALLTGNILSEPEKEWLVHDIKIIKDLLAKLYDHVRQNNTDQKYTGNFTL